MEKKDWMIVKVPYGGGYCSLNLANPKNTRQAPDALQKEFERQSIFMADNGSCPKAEWYDFGKFFSRSRQNSYDAWQRMHEQVSLISRDYLKQGKVLFLGGSHTISYSTFSALCAIYGKRSVGLIVLDAHPDCCNKAAWPIHSDWLRRLVERAYVLPENVLLLSVRQVETEEYEFLKKYGIKYYTLSRLGDPKSCITDNWSLAFELERMAKLKAAYLSIDIDVVSQAFAPGTGCPSPCGVTDNKAIALVKQLKRKMPNLHATDLVEINPLSRWQKMILRRDQTVDLGVKLIKEIVS